MHLYLHIPFCKKACHYCDFHFSTNASLKLELVEAMARELILQKEYLPDNSLETVYFGGGTPSLLSEAELDLLLSTLHKHYEVRGGAEITLEANPDDLNTSAINHWIRTGVNRLSIGIQSFDDGHLKFLNRAHSSLEAESGVKLAQDLGISNISVDLIYAIPASGHGILERDVEKALSLKVPHISAYCLSIEPQTVFGKWVDQKKMRPVEDEFSAAQFELLVGSLGKEGYEQYEISNFARSGAYSRHNTSYWKRKPYLGVGPSAHSYNGSSRQWNVANNARYIKAVQSGEIPFTAEHLALAEQVNEYLLTGLRTIWGCEISLLEEISEGRFLRERSESVDELKQRGWIQDRDGKLLLTSAGKLFADRIASELFLE